MGKICYRKEKSRDNVQKDEMILFNFCLFILKL